MSESPEENGEEAIDDAGRNPTQQRMDEEGTEPLPVDAGWGDGGETGTRRTEEPGT
jgi:hypothetical protein